MHNLSVLKFGGSSLATPEQICQVAKKISELYKQGRQLIVVTSAMGKTTDQLTELAYKVSPRPNRRELDMLLTTGERVAMSLMSMALHDLNCPSISFTGSQAGVMTDGAFSNACIKELKPIRVEEALNARKVVVLAGFQGVDPTTKEITTLGRGGSDTTAIAMAAHFKANRCEILKDVQGVFAADPKIVPHTPILKKLSIDKLYEMCFWGAKVLNYRSVDWARRFGVPLFVGHSDDFSIGTEITLDTESIFDTKYTSCTESTSDTKSIFDIKVTPGKNTALPLAVSSHENVLEISLTCPQKNEDSNQKKINKHKEKHAIEIIEILFRNCHLPEPQLLKYKFYADGADADVANAEERLQALITASPDVLNAAQNAFKSLPSVRILRDKISTVTATFSDRSCETTIVPRDQRISFIQKYFSR